MQEEVDENCDKNREWMSAKGEWSAIWEDQVTSDNFWDADTQQCYDIIIATWRDHGENI